MLNCSFVFLVVLWVSRESMMYTTQYMLFISCNIVVLITRRGKNESDMKEITNVRKSLVGNLKEKSAMGG